MCGKSVPGRERSKFKGSEIGVKEITQRQHGWSNLAAAGEQIQPGVIMFMPIASPLCVVGGVQLADCSMMGFSPLRWVFPSSCLHFGQLWIYKLFSSNRRKVKCELVSFSS